MKKKILSVLLAILLVLVIAGCTEKTPETIEIKGEVFRTDLTSLDLSNRELKTSDIKPLKHMKQLKELDLSDNLIEDVRSLKALTTLESLNLAGNPVKTTMGELQAALPTCNIKLN